MMLYPAPYAVGEAGPHLIGERGPQPFVPLVPAGAFKMDIEVSSFLHQALLQDFSEMRAALVKAVAAAIIVPATAK